MTMTNDEITLSRIYETIGNFNIYLWLDDLRPMPAEFNHHVKTADDAIKVLETGRVKRMSFDHDLGPEEAGTGYDVAKWVEEAAFNKEIPPFEWRVHSANPVGARNIENALKGAERYWKEK